jgi:hypothetical protein
MPICRVRLRPGRRARLHLSTGFPGLFAHQSCSCSLSIFEGGSGKRRKDAVVAGSTGAGRAKLRLSRGFPRGLRNVAAPPMISRSTQHDMRAHLKMRQAFARARFSNPSKNLWGDYVFGRGHAGSPGSGGASPYLRRSSLLCLSKIVIVLVFFLFPPWRPQILRTSTIEEHD